MLLAIVKTLGRIVITLKIILIVRIEARLLVKVFGLRACPLPSRQGTCLLVLQTLNPKP